MIAAADAEEDAAAGQDVGHGVVFGQPERMPHRHDVEAAADLEVLGHAAEVRRHHQQVGDALRPLRLEMVLGHPKGVVAQPVHLLGIGHRLVHDVGQLLVGIPPIVDRLAEVARIFQVDRADIRTVEFGDHGLFLPGLNL